MKIVTVRRISQAFFFVLFVWFCIVTTFGVMWWQLRGWPINLFLQLDPLVDDGDPADNSYTLLAFAVGAGHHCPNHHLRPFLLQLGLSVRQHASFSRLSEYEESKALPCA